MQMRSLVRQFNKREIAVVHNDVSNQLYLMRRWRNEDAEEHDKAFLPTCPADYKRLSHGKVVVQDKATDKISLVVSFTPFESMPSHLRTKFEEVFGVLSKVSQGANNITGNGSHQGGGGVMKGVGWRIGYDRNPILFGRYVPAQRLQRSEEKLAKWGEDQRLISRIAGFFKTKFKMLAPTLFQVVLTEAELAGIPDLEQIEFIDLEQVDNAFASNLTYTYDDFYNRVHRDHDYNSYTYGIWAPTDAENGKLISFEEGFKCFGGEFVVSSYGVIIGFGACNGIVEIIWRGKTDLHCTMPSTIEPGFTRVGLSVQISERLVSRVQRAIQDFEDGQDMDTINARIKGVDSRIEEKLAKLHTYANASSTYNSDSDS